MIIDIQEVYLLKEELLFLTHHVFLLAKTQYETSNGNLSEKYLFTYQFSLLGVTGTWPGSPLGEWLQESEATAPLWSLSVM